MVPGKSFWHDDGVGLNGPGVLFRTTYVTLSIVDHPPSDYTSEDEISFVETGAFTLRPLHSELGVGWPCAPGMLVVAPRGTELARDGAESGENRCLSVAYSAELVDALRTAGLPLLRPLGIHASPRQRFLRRRLRAFRAASIDERCALRLDLIAGALFESVACPRWVATDVKSPVSGRVMRRIAHAAELIESDYARPLKLADLAAAAEMSPFHFARSFGDLVGVPPHRYLNAVRLGEAVRQILDGASVTTACYAVGFASPSHFTVAFKQCFGIVPSALTRAPNPALVRALNIGPWGRRTSKNSKALARSALYAQLNA